MTIPIALTCAFIIACFACSRLSIVHKRTLIKSKFMFRLSQLCKFWPDEYLLD